MPIITNIITYKTPTHNTKSCKTVISTNPKVKTTNLCEMPRNSNTVDEWLDEDNIINEDLCEDDVQTVSIQNVCFS